MTADETAEETVYVSVKNLAGQHYHLSTDCRNGPDEVREWPLERAERRGLGLCKRCDPDHEIDSRAQSRPLRDLVNDDDVELGVSD